MRHKHTRERFTDARGYVRVYCPDHPAAMHRGFVYEHRLVAEQMIGRYLTHNEVVHHRNHDKADNRPENLEVTDPGTHIRNHRAEERTGTWSKTRNECANCGRSDRPAATHEMCGTCHMMQWRGGPRRVGSWSAYFDACQGCGSTEREPLTHELCQMCYMRQQRGDTATHTVQRTTAEQRKQAWAWLKKSGGVLLDACRKCGRSDVRHWAHGFCLACYSVTPIKDLPYHPDKN